MLIMDNYHNNNLINQYYQLIEEVEFYINNYNIR